MEVWLLCGPRFHGGRCRGNASLFPPSPLAIGPASQPDFGSKSSEFRIFSDLCDFNSLKTNEAPVGVRLAHRAGDTVSGRCFSIYISRKTGVGGERKGGSRPGTSHMKNADIFGGKCRHFLSSSHIRPRSIENRVGSAGFLRHLGQKFHVMDRLSRLESHLPKAFW